MDRQTEQVDEAVSVLLVVNVVLVEGSEVLAVEGIRRCYAGIDDVALVELQLNVAGAGLLGLVNECVHSFAQGSVPLTVVYDVSVLLSQTSLVVLGLLVQADGFEHFVSVVEDCSARSLVNASGLHADQTVLNYVVQTYTVLAAELVQSLDELYTVHLLAVERGRNTLLKVDSNVCRLVGSLLGGYAQLQESGLVVLRLVSRILKIQTLVGEVPQVHILGVVGFTGDLDRNVVSLSVFDLLLTGLDVPDSPGSDDLHFRSQSLDCQLKTYLVVALAGAAVADSVSAFLACDLNDTLCNRRTCEGSTEQIALVLCACLQGREDEVVDELVLDILNVELGSACLLCSLLQADDLGILTNVTCNADNLAAGIILVQPRNDNGGVKSSGVCQNDLFDFLSHDFFLLFMGDLFFTIFIILFFCLLSRGKIPLRE